MKVRENTHNRLETSAERTDVPFDDEGGYVVWRSWGNGPPAVLLHGDYGSWSHYIRNIEVLSDRYLVLVPDMPGYGDSGLPVLNDIVADSTKILADGVDQLIGEKASYDVIGFSFGGIYAGHMAQLHDGRIRKVILIGTGGMGVDAPVQSKKPLKRLSRNMTWSVRAKIHRNNLEGVMFAFEDTVDDLSVLVQDTNTARTRIRIRGIPESDILLRVLPDCRAEFFGIWGTEDAYSLGEVSAREKILRELKPNIDFRSIEGAGHWVMYETPGVFNKILQDMLDL